MLKTQQAIETNICLIGLGPAGIGFLWKSIQSKIQTDILCIEAGPSVEDRTCVVLDGGKCDFKSTCHIIGGFGGSSLMAGGKLSLFPAGTGLEEIVNSHEYLVDKINEAKNIYSSFLKLKEQILTESEIENAQNFYSKKGFQFKHYTSCLYTQEEFFKAHVEFQKIFLQRGVSIKFNTAVADIKRDNDSFLITVNNGIEASLIRAKKVIIGTGKLGADLLTALKTELSLPGRVNKLEIGIRIEFPIEAFPEIDKYHQDLKLKKNECKTFCISKGGKVALYLRDGLLYTEGYDNYSKQTAFTNLGFLYTLNPETTDPLSFYSDLVAKRVANKIFTPIRQDYSDFIKGNITNKYSTASSISCFQKGDINTFLPSEIASNIKVNLSDFVNTFIAEKYQSQINVFFPELSYGGFNYDLNSSFECVPNLHLIGECSGKFIGILQAFASGLICYDKINND
jgi:uncharacterized FAD-dependent dehydrogenase